MVKSSKSLFTGIIARTAPVTLGTAMLAAAVPAIAATGNLLTPHELIVDKSLPAKQAQQQILAARTYGTFWSTSDPAQARAALAPEFTDRTLPRGRAQGIVGPLTASKVFHAAVPDVNVEIEQIIVSGDRVVTHLRFTGHFTGTFNGALGKGQPIDFIATDIYRIKNGQITDNWHLDDNLTFLQQLGVVAN